MHYQKLILQEKLITSSVGHTPPCVLPWIIAFNSCVKSSAGVRRHQRVKVPATHSVNTALTSHCTEVSSML